MCLSLSGCCVTYYGPSPDDQTWQSFQLYQIENRLATGMTPEDVLATVGAPDYREGAKWKWRAGKQEQYIELEVVFIDGKVKAVQIWHGSIVP
jgi:hypothetical protein